jgi:hypothetical protein
MFPRCVCPCQQPLVLLDAHETRPNRRALGD